MCKMTAFSYFRFQKEMIKYTIYLSKAEREELKKIINKGSHSSQTFRAVNILLTCDEGKY